MIRNLMFDLGGVIMDIRRQDCIDAFSRLGMQDPGALLGEYSQAGVFGRLESGEIDAAAFRDEIRGMLPDGVTDGMIDEAFCAFLTGIPERRLQALRQLRHQYRIYLLSNTNPIMWNSRIAEEFRKEGEDIDFYFDGTLTSYEAKCMKPDRRIFEEAARKFGIVPSETLFFDDSESNVKAAREAGFRAVLVPQGQEFYKTVALGI